MRLMTLTKKIICIIIMMTAAAVMFSQTRPGKIVLRPSSNVYARTMLFYLPLAKGADYEHTWTVHETEQTFDSAVTVSRHNIYDKPVIHDIFTSDVLLRIHNLPYQNVRPGKVTLPVILRLNRTVIERNVTFKVRYSDGNMRLTGRIGDLHIADIKHDDYYPKRMRWRIPMIIDLFYTITP